MTQISSKHWESILDVVHTANAHLEEVERLRKQALIALKKCIWTDNSTFFLFNDNLAPFNPVALNIRQKYLDLYQDHFYRFNHYDPTHGSIKSESAIADNRLFHSPDFKKSYIYNEFYKIHDIQRQLVVYLKSPQRMLGFIGLHRGDEKAEFKSWELAIAQTIAPLLSQSLENAQVFQKTKSDQDYFQAILNRTSVGVLMLSPNLEPLFINKMAQDLFARMKRKGIAFHCPNDKSRCMPLTAYEHCLELKNQLPKIRSPLVATSVQKSVKLPDNEILSYRIELLDSQATGSQTPLFMVTLKTRMPEHQRINKHKLKFELGLTKREIELIHYLFKGLKNNEIAELLYITEGTVKNHLRNIFDKMGVANRTSLIYEILSL